MIRDGTAVAQLLAVAKPRIRRAALATQRGMTLIEIMVVVAIISLIMGGVGLMAFNRFQDAQQTTAKNQTTTIEQAVMTYRASKRGKCPRTLIELRASGYLSNTPKDPWGNDYEFVCDGAATEVEVRSPGPDGESETDDDITNGDLNS
ncbi:MAG: type II secretion system protein GspG [Myxococcota bacterium]